MNYKITVSDELDLIGECSGGINRAPKAEKVTISIEIIIEKSKYKALYDKLIKIIQKA